MKVVLCATLIAFFVMTTEALICYECQEAPSNAACNAGFRGGLKNCPSNALSCENLVRKRNGQTLYYKQCKQPQACRNNLKGNTNGPQCKPNDPIHSECWCCCSSGDFCNEGPLCEVGPTITPENPKSTTPAPTCSAPGKPKNGYTDCGDDSEPNDNYLLGSSCTYGCNEGYIRFGSSYTICRRNKGSNTASFHRPPPECRRVRTTTPPENPEPITSAPTCDKPGTPINGKTKCGGDSEPDGTYLIGSTCDYVCDKEYTLDGPETTTCMETEDGTREAFFKPEPPICKPPCSQLDEIVNGDSSCPDGTKIGAKCEFYCHEGYTLIPPHRTDTQCKNNSKWSNPNPCCLKKCPPDAPIDLVIVLDSSSSIRKPNWDIMLEFTVSLISNLKISSKAANVGVFQYHEGIHQESRILLKDNENDKAGLINAVNKIRYSNRVGTNTGKALRYARTTMFTPANGDRSNAKNAIIVITDGVAEDPNLVKSQSEVLRRKGVITYAIGIQSDYNKLDTDQLLKIAGSHDRRIILDDGFKGLDERLAKELGASICAPRECPAKLE